MNYNYNEEFNKTDGKVKIVTMEGSMYLVFKVDTDFYVYPKKSHLINNEVVLNYRGVSYKRSIHAETKSMVHKMVDVEIVFEGRGDATTELETLGSIVAIIENNNDIMPIIEEIDNHFESNGRFWKEKTKAQDPDSVALGFVGEVLAMMFSGVSDLQKLMMTWGGVNRKHDFEQPGGNKEIKTYREGGKLNEVIFSTEQQPISSKVPLYIVRQEVSVGDGQTLKDIFVEFDSMFAGNFVCKSIFEDRRRELKMDDGGEIFEKMKDVKYNLIDSTFWLITPKFMRVQEKMIELKGEQGIKVELNKVNLNESENIYKLNSALDVWSNQYAKLDFTEDGEISSSEYEGNYQQSISR